MASGLRHAHEHQRVCAPTPATIDPDGLRQERTDANARRAEARERSVAGSQLETVRGHPAHQRQPRREHRPARGRRQRPRADRRPLRRDHDHRRRGADRGSRFFRVHAGGTRARDPLVERDAVLRAPPGPSGRAAAVRLGSLCPLARLFPGPPVVDAVPGHAHAPSGSAGRALLPGCKGARRRVYERGRGGPGAVRVAGCRGDRQRPHPPRRAAGAGRPRGAGRNVAGGGRGLRCQERQTRVAQPRGAAARGRPAPAGPPGGGAAGGSHLPAGRRAGCRARRVPAGAAPEQWRDGARRGDPALGPGRPERHDVDQRHADPRRRRPDRGCGGHHAGPGAAGGARAAAHRVPGHGEPRAAGAAHFHQGLGRHRAERIAGARPGGDAAVLPDHRRAGRSHAGPDKRPAGCRAHRDGHAVRHARARGGIRPGGPGPQHVPEWWRTAHRPHRPATEPAARDGRPAARRAGPQQPLFQRGAVLARAVADPGRRGAGRRLRCDLRSRRGPGRAAGAVAAPVPQACRCGGRRA